MKKTIVEPWWSVTLQIGQQSHISLFSSQLLRTQAVSKTNRTRKYHNYGSRGRVGAEVDSSDPPPVPPLPVTPKLLVVALAGERLRVLSVLLDAVDTPAMELCVVVKHKEVVSCVEAAKVRPSVSGC